MPFTPGFIQLNDKDIARRLAKIRSGRAHVEPRPTKFPQFGVTHLRQTLAQRFHIKWALDGQV
jgi:hypothetical protein